MADRILAENEIALPQDILTEKVETLQFRVVETGGQKQIFIDATFRLDTTKAQFAGATVADGNYIFTVKESAIGADATPQIVFGETSAPNSVTMNPAKIITKGKKHRWGN